MDGNNFAWEIWREGGDNTGQTKHIEDRAYKGR